ncbi:MAG: GNAT family N-acetyltransferase [Thermoplasmata archaeon]
MRVDPGSDPRVGDVGDERTRGNPLPFSVHELRSPGELGRLSLDPLSDYFDPFLPHFMTEALRCGGEVWVSEAGGRVTGVLLYNEVERVASVFTRERALAETFSRLHDPVGVFSDFPLGPASEVYHVYAVDRSTGTVPHTYLHPVRAGREADRTAIVRLMREVYGVLDERWLDRVERDGEKCFVVEFDHEVVGVAWVCVVPGHARLHSLSVRPGFRRMAVGTDLWHARMQWARHAGAEGVLTEISEHNDASRSIATAGGMRPIGQLFLTART